MPSDQQQKIRAKLSSPISENINTYLEYLSDIVADGLNLIENFDEMTIQEFKRDYHYYCIHNKRFMYDMVNNLESKLLYTKKHTPIFKKPLNRTFNIEYKVRDKKAGITIPRTLSLDLNERIQPLELLNKYPELQGIELTIQNLMESTSDADFTICNIPEISDGRYSNLQVIRSFSKITPELTGKFKTTDTYKKGHYPFWIEYRVKSPESLKEKLFDILYNLDKDFVTPMAYEDWSIYMMKRHRDKLDKHIQSIRDKGFKPFRIRKREGIIADENAIRIVTPNESYMHTISKMIIDMCKIEKRDVKAYLTSTGTQKDNGYESIHLSTKYGEIQIRSVAMHYKAEHESSKHDRMKELLARRRWHYQQLYPKSREVMAHLKYMFGEPFKCN